MKEISTELKDQLIKHFNDDQPSQEDLYREYVGIQALKSEGFIEDQDVISGVNSGN